MSAGSVTRALSRSLLVGLTLLWLVGVVGSALVLSRIVDDRSDEELAESAVMLMSIVRNTDDLLMTAAIIGEAHPQPAAKDATNHFAYLVRDAGGSVLLHSTGLDQALRGAALDLGFADYRGWRLYTLRDGVNGRFVQLADPLEERRTALRSAMLWLTAPLAVLLAFAAYIVFRASSELVRQVQHTAFAVSRQDPQALGMLPLDGVVTEMRPAVEATNRLLGRLADALEAERTFTYNSAHELRTPIAGALAQAQLLSEMAPDAAFKDRAVALHTTLKRLARLAERLLALARAEGTQPLADDWVDLAKVVRMTVADFERNSRLRGRRIVGETAAVRVRGDLDAVGLALRNLIENALVHGTGGTLIRVRCGYAQSAIVLAVSDDGPGVSATEIRTLVKRFKRGAGAAGGGAGLGLAIVDTLARRMGAEFVLISPVTGQLAGLEARLIWRAPAQR
jgi:two-component system OmpR family sensor kinase